MTQRNIEVRQAIKNANIRSWQVAEGLGVHETTLYRLLRKELSQAEKAKIYNVIDSIKQRLEV